jgi:TPR repeat protein
MAQDGRFQPTSPPVASRARRCRSPSVVSLQSPWRRRRCETCDRPRRSAGHALGSAGLRKAALAGDAKRRLPAGQPQAADGPGNRDATASWRCACSSARPSPASAPAQFRLGNMFEKGVGAQSRHRRSPGCGTRAPPSAATPRRCTTSPCCYAEGAGGQAGLCQRDRVVPQVPPSIGVRDSQYNLAILLGRGLGAPADLGQSYRLVFAIAAGTGRRRCRRASAMRSRARSCNAAMTSLQPSSAAEGWKPRPLEAARQRGRRPRPRAGTRRRAAASKKPAKPVPRLRTKAARADGPAFRDRFKAAQIEKVSTLLASQPRQRVFHLAGSGRAAIIRAGSAGRACTRRKSRIQLLRDHAFAVGTRRTCRRGSGRVQIYLPIAELPISILMVLGLSGAVGFISGLFGVGGGFLLTPLLIFLDIPPAVAIATVAAQVAGSSTTGVLALLAAHARSTSSSAASWSAGGLLGTDAGRAVLQPRCGRLGQLELVITLAYVTLFTMHRRADAVSMRCGPHCCDVRAGKPARRLRRARRLPSAGGWACRWRMRFPRSRALRQRDPDRGRWRSSSASSGRCWASAAASCWCRR